MLWRSLTTNLLQLALDENSRYTVEYVIQLITQKFGRWLNPLEGPAKKHLHADLRNLAERVIKLDWEMHRSSTLYDFHFKDQATGKEHGFLYKKTKPPVMQPHSVSSDVRYQEGYPVDLVVVPLLIARGDPLMPPGDWGSGHIVNPLEVAIDMFPEEEADMPEPGAGGDAAGPSST
ncbi:hypothetical protein C8A01DRAFT_15081 [Parachaetomium inaequale]|uniref:Uncharacterized protein n=1 Tax=Parachaetomium inaequale TaxID=2588326 RepID=A0AAN6PHJ2_9PEZI|nr:hypothetical protein C8A01DRAFT_15081 [Parachaetomium inaequale]